MEYWNNGVLNILSEISLISKRINYTDSIMTRLDR
jgi:hypothetical protein